MSGVDGKQPLDTAINALWWLISPICRTQIYLPAETQLTPRRRGQRFHAEFGRIILLSEVNISHERREERGEEDMTCGNLAALLGHTGGDWSLQHNGDNANVGPTGWNKDRGVKYKAALHCHDRPWQSNNAREYITILQYYMLYNVTKLHHH